MRKMKIPLEEKKGEKEIIGNSVREEIKSKNEMKWGGEAKRGKKEKEKREKRELKIRLTAVEFELTEIIAIKYYILLLSVSQLII